MANIVRDEKGTYRWVYEFNLLTNPTILITLFKIFGGVICGLLVFMLVLLVPDLIGGSADLSDVRSTIFFSAVMGLLFGALVLVGYTLYALMQGGKYCALFTMDEYGILHKQLPKQYKKAEVVSALNVLLGLATGNPGQVGIGLLSARDAMESDFANVRSIKGSKALCVIKVNEPLAKNQVYVDPEDYDWVFAYIVSHCPNATVK